ncbi:MAG: hypothetical protein FWE71_08975 [Nocardioidaceae bacterium]|nr:hypothetical protein [Nocardioidaceae bacterium]
MSQQFPPPPPPPPPGGPAHPSYGGPQHPYDAGGPRWDLGQAFGYGWTKFGENGLQLLLAAAAVLVGGAVIMGVGWLIIAVVLAGSTHCTTYDFGGATSRMCRSTGPGFIVSSLVMVAFYAVAFVYAQVVGAGMVRGVLGVTEGRAFQAAEIFRFADLGPVIATSILVSLIVSIGTALCYVPGLLALYLLSYSLFFVIDKGLSPLDAISASFEFTVKNLGPTLVWFIIDVLIAAVGGAICGVGLLVAIPVILLGTAWTYKVLNREPVAA